MTLFVVIVLYKMSPQESTALQTLLLLLDEDQALRERFRLLIFDNSPEQQQLPALPLPSEYISAPTNPGLATAYNTALQRAAAAGCAWLLLLDQDTRLTRAYLNEAIAVCGNPDLPTDVVAIVPRLVQDGRTHSPTWLPRLRHTPVDCAVGLLPGEITAFNSGSVWRVASLVKSGGFPPAYPLEFLDHATFARTQRTGGRVYLLQAQLEHRLSTERLGLDISLRRYRSMLFAERDFFQEYGSASERIFYHLRRAKQALGHAARVRDTRFALLSARAAFGLLGPTPQEARPIETPRH